MKHACVVSIILSMSMISGCVLNLCEDGETACSYGRLSGCKGDDCACEVLSEEEGGACTEHLVFEPYDKACNLTICQNATWQKQKKCEKGFDGESCVPDCPFGYVGKTCVNPCQIDGVTYQYLATRPDRGMTPAVFKCTMENGWQIDETCTQDFSYDNPQDEEAIQIPEAFLGDDRLTPERISSTGPLFPGECGICTSDSTPLFCVGNSSNYILHQCLNGQLKISQDNGEYCDAIKSNRCSDSFGLTIAVDLNTNRYHCGECNQACASSQICQDGKCISKVTKNSCVNGYVTFHTGSRFVVAYCIETIDELKKIGTRYPADNLDNAYILVNEEPIVLEDWEPIGDWDKPFSGMLFGNGKTIKVAGFQKGTAYELVPENCTQYGIQGMFGYMHGAYVEDLKIEYAGAKDITASVVWLDDTEYCLSENNDWDYELQWGMLAGHAENSTITDITLSGPEHPFVLKSIDRGGTGGLIGETSHVKLENIKVSNFNMTSDGGAVGAIIGKDDGSSIHKAALEGVTVSGKGNIGSIAGSVKYSEFTSISLNQFTFNGKEDNGGGITGFASGSTFKDIHLKDINVTGGKSYYGGISGTAMDNVLSDISLSNITIKTFGFSGGLAGKSQNNDINNIQAENIRLLANDTVGGLIGHSMNDNIMNTAIDGVTIVTNNESSPDYLGGLIGTASRSRIESAHISSVKIDGYQDDAEDIGGLIGRITDSTIRDIKVQSNLLSGYEYVGGMAGLMINTNVNLAHVITDEIYGEEAVGGMAGALNDNGTINGILTESRIRRSSGSGFFMQEGGGLIGRVNAKDYGFLSVSGAMIVTQFVDKYVPGYFGGLIGTISNTTLTLNYFGLMLNLAVNEEKREPYALVGNAKDTTINNLVRSYMLSKYSLGEIKPFSSEIVQPSKWNLKYVENYSKFATPPKMCISLNNLDYCYEALDHTFNTYCPPGTCGFEEKSYAAGIYTSDKCSSQKLVEFLCKGDKTCDASSLGSAFGIDLSTETFGLQIPNFIDIPNYSEKTKPTPMVPSFCTTEP